jgi:hypothetical protein
LALLGLLQIADGTFVPYGSESPTCPAVEAAQRMALTFAYETRPAALIGTKGFELTLLPYCQFIVRGMDVAAIGSEPSYLSVRLRFDLGRSAWRLQAVEWRDEPE